jgi:hypothetical protein
MDRHQGLIPSGTIARGGRAVADGAEVLVGAGVAVGGTLVGEGSGVLVNGMAVGVSVARFSIGIVEQPVILNTIANMEMIKIIDFMESFFNIMTDSFAMVCIDYNIHQICKKRL